MSGTFISTCFLAAPFSQVLEIRNGRVRGVTSNFKSKWDISYSHLSAQFAQVFSSHVAEDFGRCTEESVIVERDMTWLKQCDVFVALIICDQSGNPYQSEGVLVECGMALALKKPVVVIREESPTASRSYFIENIGRLDGVAVISWDRYSANASTEFTKALEKVGFTTNKIDHKARFERSNVDSVLSAHTKSQESHTVSVKGVEVVVNPEVFSPKYSHSPDFILSNLELNGTTSLLDLGCGCGIIGLYALTAGLDRVTCVDLNRKAVENTRKNVRSLGFADRAEVRVSDCYENVEGKFDIIVLNAPYWDREATNDLEHAVFDKDYLFLKAAVCGGRNHLTEGGAMYICFSNQGDVSVMLNLVCKAGMSVKRQWLQAANTAEKHIRILLEIAHPD